MANPNDAEMGENYSDGMDIKNVFDFNSGVCVLPIAEDAPTSEGELVTWSPVVILRLHAPYRLRKTRYEADKMNAPPVMPSPEKDSGKLVFVSGAMAISNRLNQSFVSFDWTVASEFTYVEKCASRTKDGFVLGSAPWIYSSTVAVRNGGFPPSNPMVGAISEAGAMARIGYTIGSLIQFGSPNGYFYNIPEYLPGTFFSDDMVNSGTPDQDYNIGLGGQG